MRINSFIVIIIMLSMVLFGCGKEQDKIVINYCKALEAGKIDEAVSYFSKDSKIEMEKAGGKQALATAFKDVYNKRNGIKNIKITERDIFGDSAKIMFVYKFNDGSSDNGILLLVKEDGKWKISK